MRGVPNTPESVMERTQSEGDCLIWTGAIDPTTGYGRVSWQGRVDVVHRLAFQFAAGIDIPSGFAVCHTCDNRRCLRNDEPDIYVVRGIARPRFGHLFLGTTADNTADMMAKGRGSLRLHPRPCVECGRIVAATQRGLCARDYDRRFRPDRDPSHRSGAPWEQAQ